MKTAVVPRSFAVVLFSAASLLLCLPSAVFAHGEGMRIVPAALSVQPGGELKVTVNGLTDTDSATFTLTGMFGKHELGTFPIARDDFEQTLKIPSEVQPGSYRLSVEGGGKSAKVVITVN